MQSHLLRSQVLSCGRGGATATRKAANSHLEIFRRLFAIASGHNLVLDRLTFSEIIQARALDGRNMYEYVFPTAALWLDKTVSLSRVEPFHSSFSHSRLQ
jgi:hypothetical protein